MTGLSAGAPFFLEEKSRNGHSKLTACKNTGQFLKPSEPRERKHPLFTIDFFHKPLPAPPMAYALLTAVVEGINVIHFIIGET